MYSDPTPGDWTSSGKYIIDTEPDRVHCLMRNYVLFNWQGWIKTTPKKREQKNNNGTHKNPNLRQGTLKSKQREKEKERQRDFLKIAEVLRELRRLRDNVIDLVIIVISTGYTDKGSVWVNIKLGSVLNRRKCRYVLSLDF